MPRFRGIAFRLAAVGLGLALLLCLEAIARVLLPVPTVAMEDPRLAFEGRSPLFALDERGALYETREERLAYFQPQSFAAKKGGDVFRIFCLGGSTVQGRPYSIETAFPAWLQLDLNAAMPGRTFEVVNCGGVSYASYRLIPVMEELLGYAPDLFILYTGHNEFLEERAFRDLKERPRLLSRIHGFLAKSRLFVLLRSLIESLANAEGPGKTVLPREVEARLDFHKGLDAYHRDDALRGETIIEYRRNVETMLLMATSAGVPLIVVNPVSNIRDCPPFKSERDASLTGEEVGRLDGLCRRIVDFDPRDYYGKIRLIEEALSLDGRHAGTLFELGTCYERLARFDEAAEWLIKAKEEDVCPLRMLEAMHEDLLDLAALLDAPVVDVKALIEARSEGGIPGDDWLLDHVHPTITGHRLIADALFEKMVEMGLARKPEGWEDAREALWKEHLDSLNPAYFVRGAARLERLLLWCRGKGARQARKKIPGLETGR